MKKRSFAFVLGVVGILALVACKSETGTSTGGAGGTGNAGGGGAATTCDDKCGVAITDQVAVCAGGTGETLFTALQDCANGDAACSADCATFISSGEIDSTCSTCLQQGTCSTQFTDCSNDI